MSLTANSSLESARRKFFMNSTYIMSRKQESNVFLLMKVGIEMSLTAMSSLESAREKIFHELDVHHVQKVGIKRFWAQEAEMSSGK